MIRAYNSDVWVDDAHIHGSQVIPDQGGNGYTVQFFMAFGLVDFVKGVDYKTAVALAANPVSSEKGTTNEK